MKKPARTFAGFSALLLFFGFGLYVCIFGNRSIADIPSFELAGQPVSRDPAAIRRTNDLSMLKGIDLESAAKQALLSGLQVVSGQNEVGVSLGHFVMMGEGGAKTFACQKFSKIALVFQGDGAASNGELPSMEVEGRCEMSTDINSISALMIPVAKILGEPVGEGDFNFREGKAISVRFANVVDQWPTVWQLRGIRLFDDQDSKNQVVISDEEMKSRFGRPFILKFKE